MTRFLSNINSIFIISVVLLLTACSTTSNKHEIAQNIMSTAGFERKLVEGGKFLFTTFQKNLSPNKPYVIYIEGDGQIVKNRVVSNDPTPNTPMLLKLITLDSRENLIYLARPCQHTPMNLNPRCHKDYWLNKRLSDDSIESINEAIISIAGKNPVDLVGFSGGGGVAVLIAARNTNIRSITTIAGNLDIEAFTTYHHSPPLKESLNPIDYAHHIKHIPQLHLSGSNDKIVPPFVAQKYVDKADNPTCVKHTIIPLNTHTKGWDKIWKEIIATPVKCD